MARWLTAATHYGCDLTGPEVAKAEEIFKEFGSIRFQSVDGIRHKALSERYYTFRNMPQKKKNRPSAPSTSPTPHSQCRWRYVESSVYCHSIGVGVLLSAFPPSPEGPFRRNAP